MPRKKVIVPPVVVEKKPKVKYISPIKDYTVAYEATIKIRQTGLQSIIPSSVRANKRNFIGLSSDEVIAKLSKMIIEAIRYSCSFCTEVVSVENIKFDHNLIKDGEQSDK